MRDSGAHSVLPSPSSGKFARGKPTPPDLNSLPRTSHQPLPWAVRAGVAKNGPSGGHPVRPRHDRPLHGLGVRAFNSYDRDAGSLTPDGRLNVDSGVLNSEQMSHLGLPGPQAWREARLRTRIDAVIAHEDMEWRAGTQEAAMELASETDLPVGGGPRKLLRAIRLGEQGSRGGGPSPRA